MGEGTIKFNGYDWSELGPVLGLDYDSFASDEIAFLAYQTVLQDAASRHDGKGDGVIAGGVRQYLTALEKMAGYLSPFCHGLRCIEHDGVMLRLVAHNLGDLWS